MASDRIAISRGLLHSLSSFCSSFESVTSAHSASTAQSVHTEDEDHVGLSTPGYLPRPADTVRSGASIDGSKHSVRSNDSHSEGRLSTRREWLERHKSIRENESKIEFVVEFHEDREDWMGTSEDEDEAVKHEVPSSASNRPAATGDSAADRDDSQANDTNFTTFKVEFPFPPMGFTLNKSSSGHAHVTRIAPGGQASCSIIRLGDCVVDINGAQIKGYNEFMTSLPTVQYPAVVTFIRYISQKKCNSETASSTPESIARSSSPSVGAPVSSGRGNISAEDVMLRDVYRQLVSDANEALNLGESRSTSTAENPNSWSVRSVTKFSHSNADSSQGMLEKFNKVSVNTPTKLVMEEEEPSEQARTKLFVFEEVF